MSHEEDRTGGGADVEMIHEELHRYVEDVHPASDALPRLLAANRRRRAPRRPLLVTAGMAVVATSVFLVALVVVPSGDRSEPAGVAPNSYLVQTRPGVITAFDLASGRRIREVARVPTRSPSPWAADGHRVYAVTSGERGHVVLEIGIDGSRRVIETLRSDERVRGLVAGSDRVAYLGDREVIVAGGGGSRKVAVPDGARAVDLALGPRGRLAILTRSRTSGTPATSVHLVAAEATAPTAVLAAEAECGPLAITWTGAGVAALSPVACGSSTMRIATFDPRSGERVAAGAPFRAESDEVAPGEIALSADRLGRFLVSGPGSRRWLVDGSHVRGVASDCSRRGCAEAPAVLWG